MLDHATQSIIKQARDVLVGKIPSPMDQCHEITKALIYKFISTSDIESEELDGHPFYFTGEALQYRWDKMLEMKQTADDIHRLYTDGLSHIGNRVDIPEAFRAIYQNALPPYNVDADTLRMFLRAVDRFPTADTETIGDAFEHLLQDTGAQGKAGQFRTPRHIIDFMVGIINPGPDTTVLDPACGTAGFLAPTYQHIKGTAPEALSSVDQKAVAGKLVGYDISPDMVKLATIHMFLQHNQSPPIETYDTITDDSHWNDHYDVILANPPFMTPKGAIKPNQRFYTRANRTEVLFVDYIATHLNAEGRAGIIVPDGIVSKTENAYKQVRQMIVETSLVAVISLPPGVFNPYSPVKTSILILDRMLAPKTDCVMFFKVKNDGYNLGKQRRRISQDDLPTVTDKINEYLRRLRSGEPTAEYQTTLGHIVAKSEIAADGDYNLNGERYYVAKVADSQWPLVSVGEVFERSNKTVMPTDIEGPVNYVGLENISQGTGSLVGNTVTENPATIKSLKNEFKHDEILYGKLRPNLNKVWVSDRSGICSTDIYVIRPKQSDIIPTLYSYIFRERRFNDAVVSQIKGAQHPRVSWDAIERLEIPLPPLEVQREIVAELDSYQQVINGARAVVEKWRPRIAVDQEWPIVELGELTKPQYGYTASAADDGDARFVRITDIADDGTLQSEGAKFIALEEDSRKFLLSQGDVLVARTGATYGKTMLFKEAYPAVFASYLIRLRFPEDIISPSYYWAFAQSESYWSQAQTLATGTGQPQFNGNVLKQIRLPVPPIETQSVIVSEIKAEQALVSANRELMGRMEQHVRDAIARLWEG